MSIIIQSNLKVRLSHMLKPLAVTVPGDDSNWPGRVMENRVSIYRQSFKVKEEVVPQNTLRVFHKNSSNSSKNKNINKRHLKNLSMCPALFGAF